MCRTTITDPFDINNVEKIKQNWSDYLNEDLENDFPARRAAHIISIKFDGLGCIYPAFTANKDFRLDFMDDLPISYLRKYSFYTLLRETPSILNTGDSVIDNQLATLAEIAQGNAKHPEELFFQFRKKWNEYFLPAKIIAINNIIRQLDITDCIFFASGYNVPYSLAHLQGNELFDRISEIVNIKESGTSQKLLFIRVFWPSHSAKKSVFTNTECNYDNKRNPATARLYNYVANRAYLVGLSLRKLIAGIEPTRNIVMFSHSFGAVIINAVVADVRPKISELQFEDVFNREMLYEFDHTPVPTRRMEIFMNAPGIPGPNSFLSLNDSINADHIFFIGYNEHDKTLLKKVFPVVEWFTSPGRGNSTSLGCNWRNVVQVTRDAMTGKGLGKNFDFKINGTQNNHDFFCYLRQKLFDDNLKLFTDKFIAVKNYVCKNFK